MTTIASLIANGLASGTEDERLARAWSLLSILIGGINIARAMKSVKAAEQIADSIKEAAIVAAGRTRKKVANS